MDGEKLILIIDDDCDLIDVYTLLLSKENYRVISAFSGEKGYESAILHKPDLIILDIMMEKPDSGFELAQKLVDNNYSFPIILSSSIAKAVSELFDIENLNIKGIIQKTADFKELIKLVKQQLE